MEFSFDRWCNLAEKTALKKGQWQVAFDDLSLHYGESHRQYHTPSHISQCLLEKDNCSHLLFDEKAVELAIWYHDFIYNIGADDNEEKSAVAFSLTWTNNCPNTTLVGRVQSLILATRFMGYSPEIDTPYLIDIDHSILGQPVKEFDEYEESVRREYSIFSDEDFRKGRLAILTSFQSRPKIFKTDFFAGIYEFQARENLARSIRRLAR